MPFLTAPDGIRLAYELEGDGPPLLLHLGAGCDADLWRAAGYLEPLSRAHRCILFDHRGHGASDHPGGAEANHIDRYVDDAVALLDHLGIGAATFWGYSNGIGVGLRMADLHPTRVASVVGSGVIGRATPSQLAEQVPRAVADYREHGWEKLIAAFEEEEGPVPEWMKERIRATDLASVIGWSEARLAWGWSSWDALPRITAPVLFVVGELEDPEDLMAEAAGRLPDGRRVRVPGRGHITGFLDSAWVLPRVQEFLAAGAATHPWTG